jgi:hypothetical protein
MFKNILIATDGSDLAAKAVEQGVLFAKEIGAKITAVTVTEPFHLLSATPSQLEYTPIEYKKYAEAHCESARHRFRCSKDCRCRLRNVSGRARARLSSNHRCRDGEKVRFDRYGFARASRCLGNCPRQRDGQSPRALEDPGTRVSLSGFLDT